LKEKLSLKRVQPDGRPDNLNFFRSGRALARSITDAHVRFEFRFRNNMIKMQNFQA